MYRVTTVKKKRRHIPTVHIKHPCRIPYSNAAPINSVTFQEQFTKLQLKKKNTHTHSDLIKQTSEKLELTRLSDALP